MNCSWAVFLAKVMAFAATENGVRGVKIHWRRVVVLAERWVYVAIQGLLEVLFPAAVFVNIVCDRPAQAISLFRAETTGEWFCSPGSWRRVRP